MVNGERAFPYLRYMSGDTKSLFLNGRREVQHYWSDCQAHYIHKHVPLLFEALIGKPSYIDTLFGLYMQPTGIHK